MIRTTPTRARRPIAGPALAALLASLPARGWSQAQPRPDGTPSTAPAPSAPVKTAPPTDAEDQGDENASTVSSVTVTARKGKPPPQVGAVVGDIKPELQLSPADVQSYGVSTVTELLNELSPETRSDRGRGGDSPVVLLNGRRISSFSEIQNIPTEAILRVDILPEEVSLKYGYTADQIVVNIVLRRRFRAITGELVGGGATEGGEATGQAEVDLLHLRGDSRLNLDLKYQGTSHITDAARDIIEPPSPDALGGNVVSPTPGAQIDPALSALVGEPVTVAGVPASAAGRPPTLDDFLATAGTPNVTDVSSDRTLQPATQSLAANAVLSQPVPGGIKATINASLGATTSDSLQGLPALSLQVPAGDPFSPFGQPVDVDRYVASQGPLGQSIDGWTAHLGSTLNRDLGEWRLSLTDAYDHAYSLTRTDMGVNAMPLQALLDSGSAMFDPFAPLPAGLIDDLPEAIARVSSDAANIQLLANGPLLNVPAGQLYVSAKAGDTQSWLDSSSQRLAIDQAVALARNDGNAQLNLDLPLTSRDNDFLPLVGELSVNMNAAVDTLSDYGVLKSFGYGLTWTPIPGYNLIVSHTNDQAAPTIQQLGDPVVQTPGVTVFDYATGQSVEVTQVSGGDRALTADNRNVLKVGLTLKPLADQNLTIVATYIRSDIDHAIETFPAADAAIEAAFPDRFIRDADGELVEEDERPVNFAKADRAELRWGFNYSRPIGPQPPPRHFHHHLEQARSQDSAYGEDRNGAAANDQPPATPDGAGSDARREEGGGGGGGHFGGYGRGGGHRFGPGGRFQVAVYHTIYFVDRMLVRPGGPTLDLLNGAAASNTGGQYKNEVQGQLGATLFGFGARLSADWRSATFVTGGAGSTTGDLFFSDITTINLRLFDNLGQQPWVVKRYGWLRGSRVTLNITNLFDQRVQVHDAAGATPISYQPGYIDPVGRAVTPSIRKLFF